MEISLGSSSQLSFKIKRWIEHEKRIVDLIEF
jgi:hypothetical protein